MVSLAERKRLWRLERARWLVCLQTGGWESEWLRNESLRAIAARNPSDVAELRRLPRVTDEWIGYWGDLVIAVLAARPAGGSSWRLAQRIADEEALVSFTKPTPKQAWTRKVAKWKARKESRAVARGSADTTG